VTEVTSTTTKVLYAFTVMLKRVTSRIVWHLLARILMA